MRRLLIFHSLLVSYSNRCMLSSSSWRAAGAKQAPGSPWNLKAVAWPVLLQAIESSGCVIVQSIQWLQRACFATPTACNAQFGEGFPCSCSGISLPVLLSHSALIKSLLPGCSCTCSKLLQRFQRVYFLLSDFAREISQGKRQLWLPWDVPALCCGHFQSSWLSGGTEVLL